MTESINESLALAHANTARKLAGRNDGWDSPVDAVVARSTVFHLKEALQRWTDAADELVPLTSTLKCLDVFVDASLTGRASVMVDSASGGGW